MHAIDDVADSRLTDSKEFRQLGLRKAGSASISVKCLHGPQCIGNGYTDAIGQSDYRFAHAFDMSRRRSVLDRALEALAARYPRERPTQVRLAALAGVKQPTVNEWREGFPSMDTAVRLSENLGICVEWLLTERGPRNPPKATATDESAATALLRGLDEKQREQLERFAAFIRDE